MKQLLLGIILMVASSVTFAATEIWMMHNPACQFCNGFLEDHGITSSDQFTWDSKDSSATLVILDLTGGPENAPPQILKAIDARVLPQFRGTPHFYRWDTATFSVTGQWTGWHPTYVDDFRTWVLTGDDPRR